jgi:hypothetical protein
VDIETLAKQVEQLQKRIQVLQDENDIRKLENAYGYFLEHLMVDEIADCWADKGALEWLGLGVFRGKESIRETWKTVKQHFAERGETRHMGPRFTPYITVAPDGKTAKARWYVAGGTFGAQMLSEDTYVKEDGVWKIDLMSVGSFPMDFFGAAPAATSAMGPDAAGELQPGGPPAGPGGPGGPGGGMSPEREEEMSQEYMSYYSFTERLSRTPRQEYAPYLRPFSFRHPVTGKDVNPTVEAWNKANPCPMPPGGERWTENR